ncbi:class I SAM-dependent methyltransferase [Streptomyces niveus]|uniref:class I SAM-dependent methyltransferase n=1 Tax=Streptomyces niveus TaxID=193462 RepID=UPI0036E95097
MATAAAYDEIADWYEHEFLGATDTGHADPLGLGDLITELLGEGTGTCLEIGCGTGVHAARVRALGRTPVGVDLSAGMLGHAHARLPVARADAERLPFRDGSLPAVLAVMTHTDMPGYLDGHWTTDSWTDQGLRDKVGATHRPLPELLHAFLDAGLTPERFAESGGATPLVLATRARSAAGTAAGTGTAPGRR